MSALFVWGGPWVWHDSTTSVLDPGGKRAAFVITVLGMETTEERDVHPSCTVEEMGSCRTDKRVGDRSIATGTRCCRRRESPLGFKLYSPVLDPKKEMEVQRMPFFDTVL